MPGDITKTADLDRLHAAVAARGQGLDVLFANPGPATVAKIDDLTEDNLDQVRHTQRHLAPGGRYRAAVAHDPIRHLLRPGHTAHVPQDRRDGSDLKSVMDRLGHVQIQTTQKYLHALPDADQKNLDALERVTRRT